MTWLVNGAAPACNACSTHPGRWLSWALADPRGNAKLIFCAVAGRESNRTHRRSSIHCRAEELNLPPIVEIGEAQRAAR